MYSYLKSFIVNKGQVDESTFYYVFALKLKQYIYEQVLIQGYLDYQLKTNFNNDHASFKYFLRVLLRQHPYLIYDRDLISTINDYIDTFQSKIQPETFQVRSYLLYEYERIREEYFIKNAVGFAQVFSDLKKYDFINPGINLL